MTDSSVVADQSIVPAEHQAAEKPKKVEEPVTEDWEPPSKTSKKAKKGKKSKDQSGSATPIEEPVSSKTLQTQPDAPVTPTPEDEPIFKSEPGSIKSIPPTYAPETERIVPAQATSVVEPKRSVEPEPGPEPEPEPERQSTIVEVSRVPSPQLAPEPHVSSVSAPSPVAPAFPSKSIPVEAPELSVSHDRASSPRAFSGKESISHKPAVSAPISVKSQTLPSPKAASPVPTHNTIAYIPPVSADRAPSPRSTVTERPPLPSALFKSEAANQVIEDDRPPAPTPPLTRARPRRAPVYDDDDDDDSAIIQPRLRGDTLSRDSSRGSYPPAHSRPLFASRVPQPEHYSNPPPPDHYSNPPPPAPPQYHHPRHHYPPAAPPYYHESSHPPSHAPTHSMSQAGGYPEYSPYGPHSHGSSPHGYQDSWNHIPPNYGYNSHSPPQRHDPMRSRGYPGGLPAIENGSAIDDGLSDTFFSRISHLATAIPDLHVLLAKYKETNSQLAVREDLLRRATAEHQEKLCSKDDEIQTMRDRITSIERKHSNEASRLRFEVGNMEEQVKDLKDRLAEAEKFRVEAGQLKVVLDATISSWETKYKELEDTHTAIGKASSEEIAKTRVEFEEWKTTTTSRNDAEKIALAIQFDKKLKEADDMAGKLRQEASTAHIKEKDDLRSEHQRQQREREESFDRLRAELEQKLGASQLDCEQALKRERETMEVWAKERATLVQAHREDVESLRKSWEEQRSLLEGQHKKIQDESDRAWVELNSEANKKAEDSKVLVEHMLKDKEELLRHYNELKLEHEKEKQIIKSVATNLESEKSRLEKLMESYGDIAEIKSKGDTY